MNDCQNCLSDPSGLCYHHELARDQSALMKDKEEKGPVKITDRTAMFPTMPFYAWIRERGD